MRAPREETAEVVAALPLSRFQVRLVGGELLTAFLHRGLVGRVRRPEILPGTLVTVQRSPYDPALCRIVGVQGR
jgi:translation initiation factor IF-1